MNRFKRATLATLSVVGATRRLSSLPPPEKYGDSDSDDDDDSPGSPGKRNRGAVFINEDDADWTKFIARVSKSSEYEKLVADSEKEDLCRMVCYTSWQVSNSDVKQLEKKVMDINLATMKQMNALKGELDKAKKRKEAGEIKDPSLKDVPLDFYEPLRCVDDTTRELILAIVGDKIRELLRGNAPPSLGKSLGFAPEPPTPRRSDEPLSPASPRSPQMLSPRTPGRRHSLLDMHQSDGIDKQKMIDDMQRIIEELEDQVDDLKLALERKKDELKDKLETAQVLTDAKEKQRLAMAHEVTALKDVNEKLTHEKKEAESRLGEMVVLESQNGFLVESLAEASEQIQKLEGETTELKSQVEQAELKAKEEEDAQHGKLAEFEGEVAILKSQNQHLQAKLSQLQQEQFGWLDSAPDDDAVHSPKEPGSARKAYSSPRSPKSPARQEVKQEVTQVDSDALEAVMKALKIANKEKEDSIKQAHAAEEQFAAEIKELKSALKVADEGRIHGINEIERLHQQIKNEEDKKQNRWNEGTQTELTASMLQDTDLENAYLNRTLEHLKLQLRDCLSEMTHKGLRSLMDPIIKSHGLEHLLKTGPIFQRLHQDAAERYMRLEILQAQHADSVRDERECQYCAHCMAHDFETEMGLTHARVSVTQEVLPPPRPPRVLRPCSTEPATPPLTPLGTPTRGQAWCTSPNRGRRLKEIKGDEVNKYYATDEQPPTKLVVLQSGQRPTM